MKIANINRFIQLISAAFADLQVKISLQEVEQMAMVIHSSMESPRRRYHSSDHALHMCEDMNPRQVLAAVFHDLVYYQLDNGFPPKVAHLLTPLIGRHGNDLVLRRTASEDHTMRLCMEIFNFKPGQVLPLFRGMNEFLSAAVAVRMLHPFLSLTDLIAVVACIEATVPFRAPEADGRDSARVLADRVRKLGSRYLDLKDGAELENFVRRVMHDAIGIANRDVDGFAEPNPGRFVSGTWLLIEESNAPLAAVGVYTLQDYRGALARMHDFLSVLPAERVFHHYADVPSAAQYQQLTKAATANLRFTVSFLRLKMLSITVIEALALATGGNCPVSMFLGDIRANGERPERVEDHLPAGPDTGDLDAQLLQVLEKGRPGDASNDLAVSPLTAFMYRYLGPSATMSAIENGQRMVRGEMRPLEFLQSLQPAMVCAVIDACAHIALSRKERLMEIRASLAA
jgi:hypothetical protein